MSPLAQGLFHQAISQSGTAVLKAFITRDPLKSAKVSITPLPELRKRGEGRRHPCTTTSLLQKIAHLAGCDHNSTKIMVECLKALPAEKVMLVSKKMVGITFQLPSLSACML